MATQQVIHDAVKTAQGILREHDQTLVRDGRWGTFTNGVYANSPRSIQIRVDTVLSTVGVSPSQLYLANQLAKRDKDVGYLNEKAAARAARGHVQVAAAADVDKALQRASEASGVSYNVLKGFAQIESRGRSNAVNGSSRGLFQMQPGAWADAKKLAPSLGDYNANWSDPYQNALAGAFYLKVNQQALRSQGYTGEISPAVLYLAHQQGAAGFIELYRAATGQPTKTNYVTDEKMLRNPPPDGKGPTRDKVAFYQRWLAVAASKTIS